MNREGAIDQTKPLPRPSQLAASANLGPHTMTNYRNQKIDIIFSHCTAAALGLLLGLALLGVFDR